MTQNNAPIDARPVIPVIEDNAWQLACNARDTIYDSVKRFVDQHGVQALVWKSGESDIPISVQFELWIPTDDSMLTERAVANIRVLPRPFRRYPLEFLVRVSFRGRAYEYPPLKQFAERDVSALLRHMLFHDRRPLYSHLALRKYFWQFWRPPNVILGVSADWTMRLVVVGLLLIGVWTFWPNYVGSIFIALAGLVGFLVTKRKYFERTAGRPEWMPRSPHLYDYWQVVVSGLGPDCASIKAKFLTWLQKPVLNKMQNRSEIISYRQLNEVIEREHIAVSFNRALVFCQLYEYDNELYVGWEGLVNLGSWEERILKRGIDRRSGVHVRLRETIAATESLTFHDLADMNVLNELVHAKLVELVKEAMAERQIKQEVDFKVNRGDRPTIEDKRKSRSLVSRFLRLG